MEDEIYKKCVSTEEIYDIINGEASEELCDLLAEHIKHCEKCRHEYESIKAISSALKDMTSEPSADFAKNTLAKLKKVKKNPILRITGHPAFKSVTAVAACLILVFIVCSRGIFGTAEEMLFKRNNNDGISVISESDLVDETSTNDFDVSLYTTKSDENIPGSTPDKVDTVSDGEPIPAPVAPAPTPVDPAPFDPANSGKSNDTDDAVQNSAVTVPNATEVVEPLAPVPPAAPMAPEMPYDYYEPTEPDPDTVWTPTGEENTKEATVQTDPNYVIPDANKPESPVAPPELPSSAPAPVVPNSATSDAGPGNNIEVANPSASDSGSSNDSIEIPTTICPEGPQPITNPSASDAFSDNPEIPEHIYFPTELIDNVTIIGAVYDHETTLISTAENIYFMILENKESAESQYNSILEKCEDRSAEYADIIEEQKNYVQEPIEVAPGDPVPVTPMLPEDYGKPTAKEIEEDFFIDILKGHETSCAIYWYENGIFYRLILPLEYLDGNEVRFKELSLIENPVK
ncbi:MAG: hypothetical protein E7481_04990 [Ruminococcaceae bacterium]|nr:hypothetical protein [Oscillospiraceae bacterium]